MNKKGVLLINLGTPESPANADVARYLREFLMDERVIDIPYWKRWMLVNLIIVPFRAPKVSKEYRKLWTENGSPLLHYGKQIKQKLQYLLGLEYQVELAMRYQNPSIEQGLLNLRASGADEIMIVPLFPQYASATVGSVHQKVMEIVQKWHIIPKINFVSYFHQHPLFISTFANKVKQQMQDANYDHILFSYHGIPERHLAKMNSSSNYCDKPHCSCSEGLSHRPYCYRTACFETSRLIATEAGINTAQYSTSFQSRLGKDPWIKPYTDYTIKSLAEQGAKKLLVVSPSFVADCLETVLEIGEEYYELFLEHGGESLSMVESLNDDQAWAEALKAIVLENNPQTSLNNYYYEAI